VLLGAAALVLSGGFAPRSVGPPPTA
jgi:hypothetical protein